MLNKIAIPLLTVLFFLASCAVRKHLPEGTYLYNGASVKVTPAPDNKMKTRSVRKTLEGIAFPAKNKMILGHPYKVGMWYFIGAGKKEKGFRNWLRNRFGEPPVLDTDVDIESNEENMRAYLENRGYFKSTVEGDTTIKGYKMKANYQVMLTRPYFIDSVKWALDSSQLTTDILSIDSKDVYVKQGQQFDLENIKAEGKRIDLNLKTKGYYYFSPDYVKTFVDTTVGDHKANLFVSIKKDAPVLARMPQTINYVMLFPNYTLLEPPPDTSKVGVFDYDGIYIRDSVNDFKPQTLTRQVTYRPGQLYNLENHNESLNRFINLGPFKFVKTRYEPSSDSLHPSLLNVYYYLTPKKKKNIVAEIGGFTKSNSFTGMQGNLNWTHRNLFKGAEKLNIRLYGATETAQNDSLKKNNNFRLGTDFTLTIPRFVLPFKVKENAYYPPKTNFLLGYEWARRQLLYTKNFFRFQYDLNWKKKTNLTFQASPASVTYNNTTAFSDVFKQKLNKYPILQLANQPELILGSFFNFTYNSANPSADNIWYFNGNVDLAGNIAGLFNKADSAFDKQIAGAFFAQYAKLDLDMRYTRKLASDFYWANRVEIGASAPYGNSAYIPFAKQFIIGGSNSLRGFRPRTVGPGSVLTSAEQQVIYPQIGGDYKLEMQTELRFPLVSILKGALFLDAGNIWTKKSTLFGEEGKFTNKFLQDLAVDAGVGFRVDITLLIIRLDIGVPIRKPWLPLSERWQRINLNDRQWRRDNIVYNIGIGYPF